MRQPGGEIGDMGYHMAGTAEFSSGEDTFIALHDTDEPTPVKRSWDSPAGSTGSRRTQTANRLWSAGSAYRLPGQTEPYSAPWNSLPVFSGSPRAMPQRRIRISG